MGHVINNGACYQQWGMLSTMGHVIHSPCCSFRRTLSVPSSCWSGCLAWKSGTISQIINTFGLGQVAWLFQTTSRRVDRFMPYFQECWNPIFHLSSGPLKHRTTQLHLRDGKQKHLSFLSPLLSRLSERNGCFWPAPPCGASCPRDPGRAPQSSASRSRPVDPSATSPPSLPTCSLIQTCRHGHTAPFQKRLWFL